MRITARPMAVFWRFGLLAVALVAASSLLVQLCGSQSPVALVVMPVFLLLFQVPYIIVGFLTGAGGAFRPLFYGSLWMVIPFWTILVFLWNGSLAALFSFIHVRLSKSKSKSA